ncbi:MAG: DUF4215 domain-containing protein [Polyangiaceae bacterium]|nr:DUF4215 domain-containing protein [Polyangiaceae bacterium]
MRISERLSFFSVLTLGALLGGGCEIMAQVDRSQIDPGSGGAAGQGGDGPGGGGQGGGGQGGGGQGGGGQGGGGQGGGGQGGGGQGGGGQGGGPTGCVIIEDCPAPAGPCEETTCTNGVCGFSPLPDQTPIANQTMGDCKAIVCDGAGNSTEINDDLDVLVDATECTIDFCTAGTPMSMPTGFGAPCMEGNGELCDGNGVCVPSTCGDAAISGAEVCDDGNTDDGDGCDSNCTPTGCGNGIPTFGEECDDGNMVEDDDCTSTCKVYGCGNGIVEGTEACDDGNFVDGDGCDSNCTMTGCGNGALSSDEGCDDENMMDGDGCSATCQPEADWQCTTNQIPSVCTLSETDCGDGMDNDNDGMTDVADSDCALANEIFGCNAGETMYVMSSVDVPKSVADEEVVLSRITASHPGLVKRAVVKLSITHPFVTDLDIALVSPFGTRVALSTDNGEDGMNYTDTLFDDACMTSIYEGTAPFTGCYWPQDPLLMLVDEAADGEWALEVGDDALGDQGFVKAWSLALCVAPLP